MCWSMARFIRNGGASCSTEFVMMAASASPACHRYGHRYASSRRIRRAS